MTEELTKLQLCCQGDEDSLEETELTAEEAMTLIKKYKEIVQEVETFSPEFPETASAELIAVINVCQPVKKFLSFSLLKLIKRAIQEVDLDLLAALVQDLQIDFRQGPFKSLAI